MAPPCGLRHVSLHRLRGGTARVPASWLRQVSPRLRQTEFRTKTSAAQGSVSSRLPPLGITISKGTAMLTTRFSGCLFLTRHFGPNQVRRSVARLLGLAAVAIVFLSPSPAGAATYYWQTSSGDWSQAANWGGVAPTANDAVIIDNNGTATVTEPGPACSTLWLGDTTGSGNVQLVAGGASRRATNSSAIRALAASTSPAAQTRSAPVFIWATTRPPADRMASRAGWCHRNSSTSATRARATSRSRAASIFRGTAFISATIRGPAEATP